MTSSAPAWMTFVTLGVAAALTQSAERAPDSIEPTARGESQARNPSTGQGGCWEPAEVFIEPHQSGASFDIEVIGPTGNFYVTIVAGMSPATVTAAINVGTPWTSALAELSSNSQRVAVRSTGVGSHQVVTVKQHSRSMPIIYARPVGGEALSERTDYGCSFGIPECADAGVAFLSTGQLLLAHGHGTTTLFIASNAGLQQASFASGTSQSSIISAIQTFEHAVGVDVEQCIENNDRVAIRSRLRHEFAFVSVQQVGGSPPIVVDSPTGGTPGYSVLDNGRSAMPGDSNCDRVVNVSDLLGVLQSWGACSTSTPSCAADLTGDGNIGVSDLLAVILNWGNAE